MIDPEIHLDGEGRLDWRDVFGNARPVELELGFGKARFLLAAARSRPGVNFLGVEMSRKWYREGRRRILRDPPANLRVLWAEALDFLARKVPDASLQALHVYHPDPWPKRRHHKRRLLTPAFLAQARRVLAAGGELRVTTDHAAYGALIGALLAGADGFETLPWGETGEALTHFEAKYRREGRAIHRYRTRRREAP
ncbi:MAG: tRNA (guanosine(46)-N7)-methyltransferase TrmB [Candidatus Krumholzibacteriota bacterium]|nr:tRNA (guanosine(46)-N7)-methyltransferase TrmB [Candidatus Krumholzibacteriota bacterium]